MVNIIIFSIIALSIFIFTVFRLIKDNNANYILALIPEFIGIIINFICIFFTIEPSIILLVIMYAFSVFIPIIIIIKKKREINIMEILNISKAKSYEKNGQIDLAKKQLIQRKAMPGVGKLLKQAQKMQKAMEAVQNELANLEVEGSAAGGAVKAVVSGQGALKSIKLDPEFLKEDVSSVEASIVAAVQDAAEKAKQKSEEEMNKVTGGFSIPGLL